MNIHFEHLGVGYTDSSYVFYDGLDKRTINYDIVSLYMRSILEGILLRTIEYKVVLNWGDINGTVNIIDGFVIKSFRNSALDLKIQYNEILNEFILK